MKYLLNILIIAFISLESFAQSSSNLVDSLSTIKGIVVDFRTKEPLLGANVLLEGTYLGASCDIDGKFEISNVPPGKYSIRTSCIGYPSLKQHISIKHNNSIDIIIEFPDEIELWARKAEDDIANGNIQFLCGGLTLVDPAAAEAAKKFNFTYNLMGCDFIYEEGYNKKVEEYLENTYGPNWRQKFDEEIERIRSELENE